MTKTATTIVTALGDGPKTARDLSQRLDGIGYAAIRQSLRRMANAGVVTKLSRGLYGLDCDKADCGGDASAAYEALHPETVREAKLRQNASSRQLGETGRATRFTADTAAKTKLSERAIQRNASRGAAICEDALACAWADFAAQNDPYDPRAWV